MWHRLGPLQTCRMFLGCKRTKLGDCESKLINPRSVRTQSSLCTHSKSHLLFFPQLLLMKESCCPGNESALGRQRTDYVEVSTGAACESSHHCPDQRLIEGSAQTGLARRLANGSGPNLLHTRISELARCSLSPNCSSLSIHPSIHPSIPSLYPPCGAQGLGHRSVGVY